MRLPLLLVALPLWAAPDASAILQRLIEAQHRNDTNARQYTFVEETQRFTIDKNGQPRPAHSATHEVIFVEGLRYNKLIARDGRPLSPRELAQVEKDMRQTAGERRKHVHPRAPGGAVSFDSRFIHRSADLGSLEELLTLFDNRLAGEEEIRGHKVWVIESTPQNGHAPAGEHEKQVLGFHKTFWIDEAENVLVRQLVSFTVEGSFMAPGSTLAYEYEKIDGETWQPVSLVIDFSRAKQVVFKPEGRTVYRMSKFQKFDVQSTITVTGPDK